MLASMDIGQEGTTLWQLLFMPLFDVFGWRGIGWIFKGKTLSFRLFMEKVYFDGFLFAIICWFPFPWALCDKHVKELEGIIILMICF